MTSSAVRVHIQKGRGRDRGRGRGRGISPTRNTLSLSPPVAFRNPPSILRNTVSPSPPPPRNPPPGLRNTASPSPPFSFSRNLVPRNFLSIPRSLLQDTIDRRH